jgi:hypothetical protein
MNVKLTTSPCDGITTRMNPQIDPQHVSAMPSLYTLCPTLYLYLIPLPYTADLIPPMPQAMPQLLPRAARPTDYPWAQQSA